VGTVASVRAGAEDSLGELRGVRNWMEVKQKRGENHD
jgi:hypothetical protein